MKLILIFLCLQMSVSIWGQTSYVGPTEILHKKGYQLGVSTDFFSTSKRIDSEGKDDPFEDGESFNRTQAEVFGSYGLLNNLQLGGGARFVQNNSVSFNPVTSENESEASTGIQSTFINFNYTFKPVDRLYYSLEGLFRYMPYTNEEGDATSRGSLVLGDEGNETSAGFGLRYTSNSLNVLTGRIGYRVPGSELSSEIYWQVEGALVWRHFALIAGVNGVNSMNNDPYDDDPGNKPDFNTGSTNLYNSINREFIAPYAGIGIALSKDWRTELRATQVVSGRSTDLGTSFGISLVRRVDQGGLATPDSKFKEYDFEASVTKVSTKKGFVVIDKGLSDDLQKGMKIDFFEFDYVGGNILLARGVVISTKAGTSVVKIIQQFNTRTEIKEGIIARGSFR